MNDPRASSHQWAHQGQLDLRRGARFVIVCASHDTPYTHTPKWAGLTLSLNTHTTLFVAHAKDFMMCLGRQHDGVRLMRLRGDQIVVRRDGLGRSLMMGTRLEGAVALGNDPEWLLEHSITSRSRVCERRLMAHQCGWDRHDISARDFMDGLWRVLPGHQCVLEHGTSTCSSWWAEDVSAWHARQGHAEDVDAMCDVLDSALSEHDHFGLAVSSGLDSTLLAARCHTLGKRVTLGSMSFPGLPSCDETERVIEWNHTMGVSLTNFFDMTQVSPWGDSGHNDFDAFGPQGHPGERYEREFVSQFATAHTLDTIMTGVGADQLFEIDPWHVLSDLIARGQWDEIMTPHWRAHLGSWGVLGGWAQHHVGVVWRGVAPTAWRRDRLHAQLLESSRSPQRHTWAHTIVDGLMARDEVWGADEDRVARRRWLKSWEWEGLMRALWRLEHASGVRIQTPYLDERVWRWGVWLSPQARRDGFAGRTFGKFLLRKAHAHHADLFPEGFARRGKAAVFDEHIRRGMMGADRQLVDHVLGRIVNEPARARALSLWARVEAGSVGGELVELCRIFATAHWQQRVMSHFSARMNKSI